MELINKYFSDLTEDQLQKLELLRSCLLEWNDKLNLISRQDAENLEERHLLSSLSIAKLVSFPAGSQIMDVGTGGGLPGLPLAILYPDCEFLLVDSIAKKIAAVRDIVERLKLSNVEAIQCRVEDIPRRFDFITGRAVKALPVFMSWVIPALKKGELDGVPRGVLYLKGGDLSSEYEELGATPVQEVSITDYYPGHDFFDTKSVLQFRSDDLLKSKVAYELSQPVPPKKKRKKKKR